jgi:cyclopropane-fatty-acyl-phospholipid synthase
MADNSLPGNDASDRRSRFMDRFLRGLVQRQLAGIEYGRLRINDDGRQLEFGEAGKDNPEATITICDSKFYRQLVLGGSLGAAEAFIHGYWTCEDLVGLVRLFCRNPGIAAGLERGPSRLLKPLARIAHYLQSNTEAGSRRNIASHYDLSNDFFSLFLDETMAYSCAIFPQPECSLRDASIAKFDRICRKLELSANDHLLEIGTGWGGFALYAAQQFGCRVTTTTISRKQYEYARQKVVAAGLSDRVTVLCDDYRKLAGCYDKLVSIEMIEAVGHQYFDTYFRVCSERLKPAGMMLLQAITIPDHRFERYRRSVDFIQRYIFPGGCLPSMGAICGSLARTTDFRVFHLEEIGPHYAETLAAWRQRFRAHFDSIRRLGFSEEFIRTWEFYLCYCEGAFREREIGDVQLLLTKPGCRRKAIVPPLST